MKVKGYALVDQKGKIVSNDCEGSFRIYPTDKQAKRSIRRRDADEWETAVEVEVRIIKKPRLSTKR